jgi:uncharacterized protein
VWLEPADARSGAWPNVLLLVLLARDRFSCVGNRCDEPQCARNIAAGAAGGNADAALISAAVQLCATGMAAGGNFFYSGLERKPAPDLIRGEYPVRKSRLHRASESPALVISATQSVLGLASGMLVGFSLGLVGGGGSILAVPLMVYVVGVPEPHVAIGTSAIAVAANAAVNLSNHARGGTVVWSCALVFAAAGIAGAFAGSILGKMLDGQKLLALFALVMLLIAMLMLKTRARVGMPDVKMSMTNLPAIVGLGLTTGTMSGFFGIGGGFLIVPALMLATGMSIMNAVSSSLVAVTAFGLTTATSYTWSGLISWGLAGLFVAGGIGGGLIGTRLARHLSARRGALNIVFAAVIIAVALYMLMRNISLSWA